MPRGGGADKIFCHPRAQQLANATQVCTDYKDPAGSLTQECISGSAMGFTGKQCIHPLQVPVVHQLFAPSEDRVRDAVKILVAEKEAERLGKGSWSFGGKMIDRPVIEAARGVVKMAEVAGMGVERLWEEEKEVKPE